MVDSAAQTSLRIPARRLSGRTLRSACIFTALAALIGLELFEQSGRQSWTIVYVAVVVQISLGIAAAGLLGTLGGRSIPVAVVIAAAVVGGLFILQRWGRGLGDGFFAIVTMEVCAWTPFVILLTLAAMRAIPSELYEAAAVDRASGWFRFRNVTLPLIAPLLLAGIVFRVIDTLLPGRPLATSALRGHAVLIAAIAVGEIIAGCCARRAANAERAGQ